MSDARVNSPGTESSNAAILAAADDARIRNRVRARFGIFFGGVLIAGSVVLWPQGLFGLGNNEPAVSIVLVSSGALLLIFGSLVMVRFVRRLKRLSNNYVSSGKPDAGFVFAPDLGLPQIGVGHGGPMDASAAQFANPNKVMNGRK